MRYGEQVLEVNELKGLMKEIAGKVGLEGNFTNHSGKRTCATQLYQAGIDEQEIGHRSEVAVRKYKRSNSALQERVSEVLNPPNVKKMTCRTTVVEMSEFENNREENLNPPSDSMVTRGAVKKSVFNNCVFHFKP